MTDESFLKRSVLKSKIHPLVLRTLCYLLILIYAATSKLQLVLPFVKKKKRTTVFPYIRLAGIIFSFVFYSKVTVHMYINVWVLLEHGCYSREDFVWRNKIAFHYAEDMSKSSSQIQMSTYSINTWSCISLQIMCCFCCDNLHMLTFVSSKVNFKIGITLIFLSLLHSNKALRICQVFMVSDWCQVYAT